MSNTKISALTALTGANVDTAADVLAIVDAGVTTTKKILVDELAIAMRATQTEMEAATSANTTVSPSVQHYHPSAAKAWGLATHPTTVSASYPAAGVSVVNNSTGNYTVTHGVTFSSTSYAITCSALSATALIASLTARTATTFTVQFTDANTNLTNPTSFSYSCHGDL